MAGPPILNPIANEVYLNFESSTPCLADRHFNYTSLIAFHCKRGVSMVSERWGEGRSCSAGRPAGAGAPPSAERALAAPALRWVVCGIISGPQFSSEEPSLCYQGRFCTRRLVVT